MTESKAQFFLNEIALFLSRFSPKDDSFENRDRVKRMTNPYQNMIAELGLYISSLNKSHKMGLELVSVSAELERQLERERKRVAELQSTLGEMKATFARDIDRLKKERDRLFHEVVCTPQPAVFVLDSSEGNKLLEAERDRLTSLLTKTQTELRNSRIERDELERELRKLRRASSDTETS